MSSYKWIRDESPVTYQKWNPLEPNGANDKCVIQHADGFWNDVNCFTKVGAICEFDVSTL